VEQPEGSKVGSLRGSRKKPVHKLSIIKMQNFPHAHNTDAHTSKNKYIEKRVEEAATCRKSKTLDSPESQKNTHSKQQ